ncbi:MAG: hypothetical protein M1818_004624 [Claussenomyces sp. TS43310]|nr:MAG: hypothetical protein M1818_004624 [Claussenomyces sp. TS43310]
MATRTVISCVSHSIPGRPAERHRTLTDAACQMQWNRTFDPSQDRLVTRGRFQDKNVRCFLLLDNGPVDATDIDVMHFAWNGSDFETTQMPPRIVETLRKSYQFDPSQRPKGLTDAEIELKYGTERSLKMRKQRILQCIRRGEVRPQDRLFLDENPDIKIEIEKEAGV